jgi:hypothetical protein
MVGKRLEIFGKVGDIIVLKVTLLCGVKWLVKNALESA